MHRPVLQVSRQCGGYSKYPSLERLCQIFWPCFLGFLELLWLLAPKDVASISTMRDLRSEVRHGSARTRLARPPCRWKQYFQPTESVGDGTAWWYINQHPLSGTLSSLQRRHNPNTSADYSDHKTSAKGVGVFTPTCILMYVCACPGAPRAPYIGLLRRFGPASVPYS